VNVFEEVLKAARTVEPISQIDGEDNNAFLYRLVETVNKVSNSVWDALSVDAQNWFNKAATARNATFPIPGPDGFKSDYAPPLPTIPENRQKKREHGIVDAIRIAAITHEGMPAKQLYELLVTDWPNVKLNTIAVNIGDIYRVIHLARQLGYWNDTPVPKPQPEDLKT